MYKLVVLLQPLLFLAGCNAFASIGQPHYLHRKGCQSRLTSNYNYRAVVTHGLAAETQNVTVTAKFTVSCNSTGDYTYHKATGYRLDVTEGRLELTVNGRSETIELDQELSANPFYFVQREDGSIPAVLFSKEEKRVVINLKKALVSGFQANFEGRTMVTESDHETEHISHYRYIVNPTKNPPSGHMVRHFNDRDVAIYAARSNNIPVTYSKEEEIVYNEGMLIRAQGRTSIAIPPTPKQQDKTTARDQSNNDEVEEEPVLKRVKAHRHQGKRRRRRQSADQQYYTLPQSFFPSMDLNFFSIEGTYTLELTQYSTGNSRKRRDVQEGETEESSLRASSSKYSGGTQRRKLNVTAMLELIHQSPEDTTQVEALRRHLAAEQSAPAVKEAIGFLNNVCQSNIPRDVAMKLKLYQILASLANSEAQQVLLSCLERITDVTERSSLQVTIALLVPPSSEFVSRLESLLDSGTARDPNSLLLVYGAIASRADVDLHAHMVAYLIAHLQEPTGSIDNTVALIHALGNSDSSQTTDVLLRLIHDDSLDVKLAVIDALRKQTSDPRVASAFLVVLASENQTVSVVAAIANAVIQSIETSGVTNAQTSLAYAAALAASSRTLHDSYVSELVTFYLRELQKHDPSIRRRLRRNVGNWALPSEEYNVIASHEDREETSTRYPKNSAHLWTQQLGVKGFNLQVTAGVFTGASESGKERKILGKMVTRVNAFGYTLEPVDVEVLRMSGGGGSSVQKHVQVSVGGNTLVDYKASTDDTQLPTVYRATELLVAEENLEFFVGAAEVDVHFDVHVHLNGSFNVNKVDTNNKNTFLTTAFLSPSVEVSIHGSTEFNVMGKEGGINLEGTVGYAFEAEGKVTGCVSGPPAYNVSTTIKDSWPSGHIRLTKPDVCSVEQCEETSPESVPVEWWDINSKSLGKVWDDTVTTGAVTDWSQCPTAARAQESELQFWWEESNMGQGARNLPHA